MEELNKSQIVLLTLLVSFVTSLATGIVTVSLMEQGVTPVYSTVNQIVERTKEIIVKVPEPQDPIIITETVTVHQSDLVAAAVAKNKNSSIIVYKVIPIAGGEVANTNDEVTPDTTKTPEDQVASAVVGIEETVAIQESSLVFSSRATVLGGGILIMDASVLEEGAEYVVLDSNGERSAVTIVSTHSGLVLLQAAAGTTTAIGNVTTLKRGQGVVILSGVDRLRVTTGIISDIILSEEVIVAIEIDKAINTPGSMLINMDGELIGISTGASRTNGSTWFTSGNIIEAALHNGDNTDG